ncbi:hypothetical protein [Streptomyces diastatochromogenes]|uniref:hypothetical protein n=1 Tax=Streptomyces diastatochromogenes TaxID=42236 RepID=UPI0036AFB6BA
MTAIHPAGPAARPAPLAPGALPVVGHLRQLLTDPTGFLTSLPAHGDLVEIRLGPRPTYVLCGPELVSQVLLAGRRVSLRLHRRPAGVPRPAGSEGEQ